ncbi:MAG TPA: alpha/beta hydrolase-fold protein [Planctomycetota bacterium]|jgi:predicted esterase|nr:alpha/beta hydrolase-fold protein [Planctomycetota bacterium]
MLPVFLALLAPLLQKPSPTEVDKLVPRYFEAPARERVEILKKLETLDPLTPDGVKSWSKRLLALAAKGPKSPAKGRNFLYDEKAGRGLYLLGGKRPGSGSLFLGLHGGGAGAGSADEAMGPWNGAISGKGWLAVYPEVLEKTAAAWGDEPTEKFVLELIETMKRTFKVDTNRIFLGGHSMGGYGTWTIGGRHADLFAGLLAFSGAPTPYVDADKKVVAIKEGVIPNLRNLPIWSYHSKDDPNVGVEATQAAIAELKRLAAEHGGYEHTYDEVDLRGHEFPNPVPPLEWIAKRVRDPRPKKVVWQPAPERPWKRMFYWLLWDPPKANEIVVAERVAPNDFAVKVATGSTGLSLLLDERLADFGKEVVVRVNGTEKFRARVAPSLATMLLTAAERNDPEMLFLARVAL